MERFGIVNVMSRAEVIEILAEQIAALKRPHPIRVAIDGADTAGKTTLADALVAPLETFGCQVIRAGLDGFHHPRIRRYRRGEDSPDGYYLDAYNFKFVKSALLNPLGPGGNLHYRTACFDFRTDTPLMTPWQVAPPDAILLFDGVFLLRPELASIWDYKIFVKVTFDTVFERAVERDQVLFGASHIVEQRYSERYMPAQRRYLRECEPEVFADAVLVNDNFQAPDLHFSTADG
jgi:uridine kinase